MTQSASERIACLTLRFEVFGGDAQRLVQRFMEHLRAGLAGCQRHDSDLRSWYESQIARCERLNPDRGELAQWLLDLSNA